MPALLKQAWNNATVDEKEILALVYLKDGFSGMKKTSIWATAIERAQFVLAAQPADQASSRDASERRAAWNRCDRACKKSTTAVLAAWNAGGKDRTNLLNNFIKHGGNMEKVSIELIRQREKTSSLKDSFAFLNAGQIQKQLCNDNEDQMKGIISHVGKVGRTRPDPNSPGDDTLKQYWVCVLSSGEIVDLLRDHQRIYATFGATGDDAASLLAQFTSDQDRGCCFALSVNQKLVRNHWS